MTGLEASVSLGWLRYIPLYLELVAVDVEMYMAQMLKFHLSSKICLLLLLLGLTTMFFCLAFNVAN